MKLATGFATHQSTVMAIMPTRSLPLGAISEEASACSRKWTRWLDLVAMGHERLYRTWMSSHPGELTLVPDEHRVSYGPKGVVVIAS